MSEHLRQAWRRVASGGTYYHLTDTLDFRLDPARHPENNTTLGGDWPEPGIFVARYPERWLNGYGYWRPWVVEFQVASGVGKDFGNETFIPATDFDKVTLLRVLPLDGYAREEYGDYGWTEEYYGTAFDTEEPIEMHRPPGSLSERPVDPVPPGYRSPDARQMDAAWRSRYEQRVKEFGRKRGGVYA